MKKPEKKIGDNSVDVTSFQSDQQVQMDVQSANSFYALAQEAYNEKRYRIAIIYLRKILQIDNTFTSAFKMLARIFQIRKNLKKAAEILRQAVEINFRDAELHYQLGYLYYLQGDTVLFARECTKALVVNPNYSKAFYALALLNYEKHKYDKAADELKKCLKLNDNDLEAHMLMAKVFLRQREFKQAQKHVVKCLQLNKNYEPAHYYLAGIALHLGDYETALEHYLLSGDKTAKIKNHINKTYLKIKQGIDKKLVADPKNINALMELADLYYRKEEYVQAKEVLQRVLKWHPQYIQAKINYGLMLVYDNNFVEGIRIYQEVLEISPANKEAKLNLDKAFVLAERYYLQYFKQTKSKKDLLNIYMLQEKYDKAVLVMEALNDVSGARAILNKLAQKNITVYRLYEGAVLYVLGEIVQARYLFEHQEKELEKYAGLYYFMGLIAKKQKRYTESYRYFDRSKMLDPEYWFVEQELFAIRTAEIERLEKIIADQPTEEVCLEYIDLLILTGAYKKALMQSVDFQKSGLNNDAIKERIKKVMDSYEHDLELNLESAEPSVDTFLDLGEIYTYKRRFNEAFLLFQTALGQYPDDQRVNNYFSYLVKKNIEVYEQMLKTSSQGTMIYYNLAIMYAISKRKPEMYTMLERAVTKDKKLAIQARYEDAFAPYRLQDRFRIITLIEGEDKNIYRVQD